LSKMEAFMATTTATHDTPSVAASDDTALKQAHDDIAKLQVKCLCCCNQVNATHTLQF